MTMMTEVKNSDPTTTTLRSSAEFPSISVILPVRNEEPYLARTLDMLLAQDYPAAHREFLVVDGESTDRTPKIAQSYADRDAAIRLLSNPRRWSSAARNIGIRASQGDLILIVDGHCQIHGNQHLRHLANAFASDQVACVGRPQPQDVSQASCLQQGIALARASRLGHHPDSFIYATRPRIAPAHSVAIAYRRWVFDRVGYFDENFDACEDVELNHRVDRAGLSCLFDPRVAVHYHPRGSLRGLFRQLARYGRGRIRLARKHPDTWNWKSLAPAAWLLFIAFAPTALWLPTPVAAMIGIGLLIYALAVLGMSLYLALYQSHDGTPAQSPSGRRGLSLANRQIALLFWLPWIFLVIHAGSGYGILSELVWPRRPDHHEDPWKQSK
jgi:succinoglycan biosynthesis protein ExoA